MGIRFGLIGFGRWGNHHARTIVNTKGAELVAVSAKSEKSCRRAKERFGVDTYSEYRDMLQRKDIDIVDIVLPNYLHSQVAVDALNHGKHVLLEKPMALTVEECNVILKAVKKNKKILHIGFEMRISPLWKKLKEMIEKGNIGKPVYGLIELWRGPYRSGSNGWRYDAGKVGSWILEEPVHFLDLACWYMERAGNPVSIYARANSRSKDSKRLTENMSFFINFPGGSYVVVNQTLSAYEHHQTVKVVGTKGTLSAGWHGPVDEATQPVMQMEYYNGKKVRKIPIKRIAGELYEIEIEMKTMVDAVSGKVKTTSLATPEEGKRAVALCIAGEKSAELNKVIQILH